MTFSAAVFTFLVGLALFRMPISWAALPLLAGATYMTLGQTVEVGVLHFTVERILVAIGVIRVAAKRERIAGGMILCDRLMILWAFWNILSACFHKDISATFVSRLGTSYDGIGLYFLLRVFIRDADQMRNICKVVIILLIPIAIEMVAETITGHNVFSFLGGVPDMSEVRGGKIRAQGPFEHSILAGTVGAVCLPMALLWWKRNRKLAGIGLLATSTIVLTCRSSGPIMTLFFVVSALAFWRFRQHLRLLRWGALVAIVALAIVMKAPVYYLLAKIDLTGSSTGWHRAALIGAAIAHWNEWWMAGTDYTRDWMPYGVIGNADNADITNHYLKMGVWGGLPLMLIFIGIMVAGFSAVGGALRASAKGPRERQFLIWAMGSIFFGHAVTMISVSYFDQTIVFFYMALAAIGSIAASCSVEKKNQLEAASI